LPIPLIEKKSLEVKLQGAKLPTKAYSHGIIALKYLAPAKPHSRALLLMAEITLIGVEAMFLKILTFLSFQISQAVRSSKEVSLFLCLTECFRASTMDGQTSISYSVKSVSTHYRRRKHAARLLALSGGDLQPAHALSLATNPGVHTTRIHEFHYFRQGPCISGAVECNFLGPSL
jgi:hypothetical protein